MSCPFQLKGLCSCRFAEEGKGVHTWYYVGTSFDAPWMEPGWNEGSCGKPAMRPSVAHTPLGVKQGLCGIIRHGSHALMERSCRHIPRLTDPGDGVEQLPRHVAAPLGHGGVFPPVGGASADTRLALEHAKSLPLQDSTVKTVSQPSTAVGAYPTDSKERERNRRIELKAAGVEIKVKKKKQVVGSP